MCFLIYDQHGKVIGSYMPFLLEQQFMDSSKTQKKNPADVMSTPSQGTTGTAAGCDDALGNPGRLKYETNFTATPESDEKLKATRMKQLGRNGYAAN
jgi:hypothetical protein